MKSRRRVEMPFGGDGSRLLLQPHDMKVNSWRLFHSLGWKEITGSLEERFSSEAPGEEILERF